ERPHVRARRRHAARRRQGVPAHAAQRRGLRRGARADARARGLLQPGLGKEPSTANGAVMGVTATFTLLADAIDQAETFVNVFVSVYTLVILAYIITSWVRLPYSPWLNRIQRFLYDVSEPYLRLFRRVLPSMG